MDYCFRIQDDIRRALHYTNQLLELEPDHPRAVGNKWYYEEALGDDGVVDDALNRRRGKQNTSCNINKWYFITIPNFDFFFIVEQSSFSS